MSNNEPFAKQVIYSFLYSGIGNTLSKVINVIALFVVLKFISTDAFGTAQLVIGIFAVVQAVTELGLGIAIVQAEELKEREVDSLFWLSGLLSVFIYLLIYFGAPFAAEFYREPVMTELIQVHGLVILVFTLYFVPRNMLKRDLLFKEIAIIDNIALFASSIIMVIFAYWGYGAWAIILGEVGNRAGRFILSQWYYPYLPRFRFNWEEVKDRVQFGVYATGSRLLYNLYSNADYLIVGRVFGTNAVGIYSFAYEVVTKTVKLLTSNLNEVAYPAFARLQNQVKRLRLYFFTLARGSLQLNSIVLILIALFFDEILLLIDFTKYMEAIPIIQLLTASAVLRTVSPLVPQLLNAVGEARLNFYYSLSNSIIMPIAFLIAAQISLLAVGWTWVLGYPIVVFLLFYFGSRQLEMSIFSFLKQAFSSIWVLVLLLGFGFIVQELMYTLFQNGSLFIPILGITVVAGVSLTTVYYREKETIALLRGKAKSTSEIEQKTEEDVK